MPDLPRSIAPLALCFALTGCSSAPAPAEPAPPVAGSWAIALHGGAGTIPRNRPAAEQAGYEQALAHALRRGCDLLAEGRSALEVCEAVVTLLEDDPHFNAGKGAVYNEKGEHELDACIMDGATLRCGAVAGVRTVRNPVQLARLVMEKTPHVLLAGEGAEQFATLMEVPRVTNDWFDTESRRRALQRVLRERERTGALVPNQPADAYGTVGCVVRDGQGRLAAATSTGGMTGKRWGRVGDAPIVGAGNYADRYAAISCTGTGEQFLRHTVARSITARMEFAGQELPAAVDAVVFGVLQKDDGGVIAVDAAGNLVARFNSEGMYHGLADSNGRFQIGIFAD